MSNLIQHQAGFLRDGDVAARALRHIERRSTDLGAGIWREPVVHYRSQSRLKREVELLRRSSVPLCPSAALPQPGSYRAFRSAGRPLLLVRDADGRARAFRNACRHRGAQLAAGAGCLRSLVCPYHGWVYGLDGTLLHVPHPEGFPDLDVARYGLSEVSCEEQRGLVFVTQEGRAQGAASGSGSLPDLLGPGRALLSAGEFEVRANWKIYLEGFLEGYHIRATHRKTFYPHGFDNLNVVETVGLNSRVTFPFRRIQRLAQVMPEERRIDGLLAYVYHLFPNVILTVLSRHSTLLVLDPVNPGCTRVMAFTLMNAGLDADAPAEAERDAQFVLEAGVPEDLAVVESIQRSLESGANQRFTFGRFEAAIVHFHRNLRRGLDGADGSRSRRAES